MATISYSDIQAVKREAKRLRTEHPDLSLTKLQDMAAAELFGVRGFHELNKWRDRTVAENTVEGDGGGLTCTFCGTTFYPDISSERTLHRKRHDAFEEAATYLGYAPKQHAEREAMKKAGYELLRAETLDKQVEGLLMVARGWFDRSLDAAIDSAYWKQHPTFEAYVSYVIGDLEHLPAAAVKAVVERYGRVDGVIPQGKSYWYPPKKGRKTKVQ